MSSNFVIKAMIGFYILLFFAYLFGPLAVMSVTAFNTPNYPQAWPFEAFTLHLVNTGSPVGTVSFEGSVDGTNFVAVAMEKADGTLATSTTATGYFRLPLNTAIKAFRAPISAYTSGEFTVLAGRR